MKNVFRTKLSVILLCLIIVLSIAIGVISASGIRITFLENVVGVIVTPAQTGITNMNHGIKNFFGYFSDVDAMRTENKELKNKNSELNNKLKSLEKAEKENETLRSMLGLKKNFSEFTLECSEVVARDPGNWFNTFTVNKGSADGILVDQTVISSNNALVGRVFEVGSNWAKIVTVTDPECSAGAQIARSGDFGVTEGDAKLGFEGKLRLSYISKNTDILVGDTLITSGLGGIFPKGIILGTVQSVQTDVQGISQYAVVVPACDLNKLEYVFIIKDQLE